MRFYKTSNILKWTYSSLVWKKKTDDKVIYLTFDDGPIPDVTEFVLDTLSAHNAKATFFCVGDNLVKYPELASRIIREGHKIGNHTQHHLNGWKTDNDRYYQDVDLCHQQVLKYNETKLFRPPHGKIKRQQVKALKGNYDIVMWDVLSWDFDPKQTAEECLNKTIHYTDNGSIVLFHDSLKTDKKIRKVLPSYLTHFLQLGFRFEVL